MRLPTRWLELSLALEPVALCTFLREARPAFRVGPGRHTTEIIY